MKDLRLTFLGAARNVTGSSYLLEAWGKRILIDCGFVQEREFQHRNWEPFAYDPASLDAVLLTHAHLDHCGLLPKLVRDGYKGPIYATSATCDITAIILRDSARIQEEDAKYKLKRHAREGRTGPHEVRPLYTSEDAEAAIPQLQPVGFLEPLDLGDGLRATWHIAGHILGAASIAFDLEHDGEHRRLLFSGDIGRDHVPILQDPTRFTEADYVVMESTYADRDHPAEVDIEAELEQIVNQTVEAGGNLVIPSFAVERAQDLLYHLGNLRNQKRIPQLMVFVDSPMAIRVTEVFRRHPELFDQETLERLEQGHHACDFPGLIFTRSANQSKSINQIRGSAIIIAGSGMCTGGRIKHHLANNIGRPESTILFVGYQAKGTLGRHILGRPEQVRILGQSQLVRARIETINGFSGHAGRSELESWAGTFTPPPRQYFITHGEEGNTLALAERLKTSRGTEALAPEYQQTVDLA